MLEQHLAVLLMKLAVAASLASILGRSSLFVRMLLREERTMEQQFRFAAILALLFGVGVAGRVLTDNAYLALDLGLEGALLAGVLGGYFTGLVGGILMSLPAMITGEYLSILLFAGVGVLGGLLRDLAPTPDSVWSFSPYFDLTISRLFRRKYDTRVTAFHLVFLLTILFAELLRWLIDRIVEDRLFYSIYASWTDPDWGSVALICATTVFAVALPLKIWNTIRTDLLLQEQQRLVTEARLHALTSQINPHFLFNTLNTVNALIRTNPDQARGVVVKLSNILRRLMKKSDAMTPLRDELSFIDDYLSIEMTRFGDKLRFERIVEPETLDQLVPAMLIQPIIENSIKHGLAGKIDGGRIRLAAQFVNGRMKLQIEDDGVGVPEAKLATMFESGIGVSNVNERLKVLYGDDYRMVIDSREGEGTKTEIEFPASR
ncbi:MAG: histidine kinase [Acidobacteria bacterium]|nr:histidine kinase [Acidobacteriota bacterium]